MSSSSSSSRSKRSASPVNRPESPNNHPEVPEAPVLHDPRRPVDDRGNAEQRRRYTNNFHSVIAFKNPSDPKTVVFHDLPNHGPSKQDDWFTVPVPSTFYKTTLESREAAWGGIVQGLNDDVKVLPRLSVVIPDNKWTYTLESEVTNVACGEHFTFATCRNNTKIFVLNNAMPRTFMAIDLKCPIEPDWIVVDHQGDSCLLRTTSPSTNEQSVTWFHRTKGILFQWQQSFVSVQNCHIEGKDVFIVYNNTFHHIMEHASSGTVVMLNPVELFPSKFMKDTDCLFVCYPSIHVVVTDSGSVDDLPSSELLSFWIPSLVNDREIEQEKNENPMLVNRIFNSRHYFPMWATDSNLLVYGRWAYNDKLDSECKSGDLEAAKDSFICVSHFQPSIVNFPVLKRVTFRIPRFSLSDSYFTKGMIYDPVSRLLVYGFSEDIDTLFYEPSVAMPVNFHLPTPNVVRLVDPANKSIDIGPLFSSFKKLF